MFPLLRSRVLRALLCGALLTLPLSSEAALSPEANYQRALNYQAGYPGESWTLKNLGYALLALGRGDEAARTFRLYLHDEPRDPAGWTGLGYSLSAADRPKEAVEAFLKAEDLKPGIADPNQVGYLYRLLGRTDDSVAWFDRALARNPRDLQALLGKAYAFGEARRTEEAVGAFRAAASAVPEKGDYQSLGYALGSLGRFDEAERAFQEGLDRGQDPFGLLLGLGYARMGQKRFPEAAEAFRRARALKPQDPEAAAKLGYAAGAAGLHQEALEAFLTVQRLAPDQCPWTSLGYAFQALGRPEEAAQAFEEALRRDPKDPEGAKGLGYALLALGRPDRALEAFRQLLILRPDGESYAALGKTLGELRNPREAAEAFRRGLTLAPTDPDLAEGLVRALAASGDPKAAREALGTLRRLDPSRADRTGRDLRLVP